MNLYGTARSRAELMSLVGRVDQVASVTAVTEDEGTARGARRIVVRSGDLAFDIHPDRAMDIGAFTFRGVPMAWISPSGFTSPGLRDGSAMGWLRSFGGGLVATCGLDAFGSPSHDAGEEFPLHGRVGTTPAEQVGHDGRWTGPDTYEIVVTGKVRQARMFGENLLLHRSVRTTLGTARMTLTDVVTNEGSQDQPHMLLYHINLGWPLLDADATLDLPSRRVIPRDETAAAGRDSWNSFHPPQANYAEQVFRHELDTGLATTEASLTNEKLGLSLSVRFRTAELPAMFQWKMLGTGTYVLGLEPANCPVIEGRATARERGELPVLAPGESRSYTLEFEVHEI